MLVIHEHILLLKETGEARRIIWRQFTRMAGPEVGVQTDMWRCPLLSSCPQLLFPTQEAATVSILLCVPAPGVCTDRCVHLSNSLPIRRILNRNVIMWPACDVWWLEFSLNSEAHAPSRPQVPDSLTATPRPAVLAGPRSGDCLQPRSHLRPRSSPRGWSVCPSTLSDFFHVPVDADPVGGHLLTHSLHAKLHLRSHAPSIQAWLISFFTMLIPQHQMSNYFLRRDSRRGHAGSKGTFEILVGAAYCPPKRLR